MNDTNCDRYQSTCLTVINRCHMFLLQNTSYLNLNIILSQNYLSTSTNMGNQLRIFFTHTLRTLYQRYNPSDSISLFIWPLTHYNNNISLITQLPALWWKEKKDKPNWKPMSTSRLLTGLFQ